MTKMMSLEERTAREFLRTAVIIDDKASMSNTIDVTSDLGVVDTEPADEDEPLAVITLDSQDELDVTDGSLDVQAVVSAYLKLGIMCGVFQPPEDVSTPKLISETTIAVVNADIVILDWFLQPGDEQLILDLLKKIFELDNDQNGRLRLIVIYTDNPKLAACVNKVKEYLNIYGLVDDKGDPFALEGAGVRVKFLNKEGSLGPEGIGEADLPARTVSEFVNLNKGLFPTFALGAINSIRKNTHHLLSVFNSELDAALVGHRLLADESDNVISFGFDTLMLQLSAILATDRVHHHCLSEAQFVNWFDNRFGVGVEQDDAPQGVVGLPLVRKGLNDALENVWKNDTNPSKGGKNSFPRQAHKRLFNEDGQKEEHSTNRLGRLSKLSREADGFHCLPRDWRPTLSMGSIIKAQEIYYFCSMPVCDAVRIVGSRYFPLLKLESCPTPNHNALRLYVKDGDNELKLIVKLGAQHNRYEKFLANATHQRTLGVLNNTSGRYVFKTTNGTKYDWVADVDALHAQRIAAEAVANMSRIGVDEFEWLRRGFRK